ncbi:molybdenum cofactor biosynthesis protein MoaE [Neisseria wadsworthii]|uniref:Molybdopterin synthase catalytic subunit n=1 Tax=Neisseria wadsworthii 9715 TaxID=1030841 RepID=G4CQT6_9NEIS|nr:molybdenum cofactor biosynthesis protein MoaE [Neisseria wadsworthii]EGZ46082.1 molybdenum cofactor biosynthesis protein large subunit [Neisseria wadsworthii 9715]QMT35176.1 molybdenum cofactor biosynthesis protein MoaE [Neisseria wadsworthii]
MKLTVRVQEADFNLQNEYDALLKDAENTGAVAAFVGRVRDRDTDTPLFHLFLEHYPEVTEHEIERIAHEAETRWPLTACTVIHRVGLLEADDQIVLVLTASEHRKAAFSAAEFLMDYLKTQAPFWKQERFSDGREHWVEAKQSDAEAADKWR